MNKSNSSGWLRNNWHTIFNIVVVIFILLLPYYIFEGKMYLGGDDTKLFYSYPLEFMKNVGPFSWYHFSSLGWHNPIQFEIPFLLFWSLLEFIFPSKASLSYVGFSLPLIVGFIYYQKFVKELILDNSHKYKFQIAISALFFVFSPIIMINQLFNFLSTVWLLGLVPIELYYFLKYFKTLEFINVFKAMILTTVFSIALFSIPWLLGFAYTLFPALIVGSIFFTKKEIIFFIKKMFFFFAMVMLSQAYWLFGFMMSYVNLSNNSFAAKVVSQDFLDTFTPVVLSTAVGTVVYPLINLFHRQITFNFGWDLKTVFLSFYDKMFILNIIFLIVFFLGILGYRKFLIKSERKIFIIVLIAFMISLYFFTVNIGPLRDLFLYFRIVPGFVALRNFYDKFAFAFVLYYTILMTFSLVVVTRKYKRTGKALALLFFIVVVVNFLPVDKVVDSPLWATKSTHRAIQIPEEYTSFMKEVGKKVSPSNNILSVPFGSSIYTVVKDETSNAAYVGSSPVIVFSGVNDISGHMSFNFTDEANKLDKIILAGDTDKLNKIMLEHNINYVILTKNIPDEVKKAQWVYDEFMLQRQDAKFLQDITSDKILTSSKGNYELFTAKNSNVLVKSNNLYFQRLSPVKFKVYIKSLKKSQVLEFNDSFHNGWELYPVKNPDLSFCKPFKKYDEFVTEECNPSIKYLDLKEIEYVSAGPVFDKSHSMLNNFSNKWTIDRRTFIEKLGSAYYKKNVDGSIDVEMILYFKPQIYFYYGLGLSFVVFAGSISYLVKRKLKNEKN